MNFHLTDALNEPFLWVSPTFLVQFFVRSKSKVRNRVFLESFLVTIASKAHWFVLYFPLGTERLTESTGNGLASGLIEFELIAEGRENLLCYFEVRMSQHIINLNRDQFSTSRRFRWFTELHEFNDIWNEI